MNHPQPDSNPMPAEESPSQGAPGPGSPDSAGAAADDRQDPDVQDDGPPVPAAEAAALVAERDDYLNQLLRTRADYDNLNKRRLREVAEARDRGAASVVEGLLEVLDNFGFALEAAAASEDTQLAKGVELVHTQLLAALGDAGLLEVPGVGATFDPEHHEALMSESDGAEREDPEVSEVLRTGYRYKHHLLRPASVKVVN